MENNERNNVLNDTVMPDAVVKWNLGFGREQTNPILWRCDALRAGRLYERTLFATRSEAEQFASRMRNAEPDQMFNVESIMASAVWN